MKRRTLFALPLSVALAGCASSTISSLPAATQAKHAVKTIAFAPGGGLLADAVGVELANRGFTVIDSATTTPMMIRLNLSEIELASPVGLSKFKEQGVDAYPIVRTAGGYDQNPQSATVRINSTHNGQVLAGLTWQNGWGGVAGSPADRVMRRGLADAANEIANSLVSRVQWRPNPAVKRTCTGGARLYTHRASHAPVPAAYLLR